MGYSKGYKPTTWVTYLTADMGYTLALDLIPCLPALHWRDGSAGVGQVFGEVLNLLLVFNKLTIFNLFG